MSVEVEIRVNIARRLGLTEGEVFGGQPMSAVLAASPTAINSIDLLDAFAGALADAGLSEDVEIPVMTLNHTADDIVTAMCRQTDNVVGS